MDQRKQTRLRRLITQDVRICLDLLLTNSFMYLAFQSFLSEYLMESRYSRRNFSTFQHYQYLANLVWNYIFLTGILLRICINFLTYNTSWYKSYRCHNIERRLFLFFIFFLCPQCVQLESNCNDCLYFLERYWFHRFVQIPHFMVYCIMTQFAPGYSRFTSGFTPRDRVRLFTNSSPFWWLW